MRFEIRMNRVLFDYVVANRLYNSIEQATVSTIDFSDGSMLIRAAWREIEAEEEPRYISVRAEVCDAKMRNCMVRADLPAEVRVLPRR